MQPELPCTIAKYTTVADLPQWQVRGYTPVQQEVFLAAVNSLMEEEANVTRAFHGAHEAVKSTAEQATTTASTSFPAWLVDSRAAG